MFCNGPGHLTGKLLTYIRQVLPLKSQKKYINLVVLKLLLPDGHNQKIYKLFFLKVENVGSKKVNIRRIFHRSMQNKDHTNMDQTESKHLSKF